MADINNKFKDNIAGIFYVDKRCINCRVCSVVAPKFFKMNYKEGHSSVKNQPVLTTEINQCLEALHKCPVNAIGNNGYLENISLIINKT